MEQRHLFPTGASGRPDLSDDDISRLLEVGLGRRDRSDMATSRRLSPAEAPSEEADHARPLVPAAVLVPLVRRAEGITILLTQRTSHLANHAGQISFPGGRLEEQDADAVAAALRESEEEIGLDRRTVKILGRLDDYVTVTGFQVMPVVGVVAPPLELVPDPFEVAEIFELPLAFVLDPANHQRHSGVSKGGLRRHWYAMPYGQHYVWGATAGMLVNLYEVLSGQCEF